jgi:hypothetical protein
VAATPSSSVSVSAKPSGVSASEISIGTMRRSADFFSSARSNSWSWLRNRPLPGKSSAGRVRRCEDAEILADLFGAVDAQADEFALAVVEGEAVAVVQLDRAGGVEEAALLAVHLRITLPTGSPTNLGESKAPMSAVRPFTK